MENLYKGAGNIKDYEHSLKFLDWVFFTDNSEEPDTHFLDILPKLYKKEYDHCRNNLIVSENGEWQAAVGLYIEKMTVGEENIICGGIGNVAVSKNRRGMGYMKDCMRMVQERCENENVDFMILGGQRQRYGYFGFEPAGREYEYCVNKTNMRHTFGKDYKYPLTAAAVAENDSESLDFIFEMYNKTFPSRIIRSREKLYDTLVSWNQNPYVFKENGRAVGYAVYSEKMGYIMEIAAANDEYFRLMIPAVLENSGNDTVRIKLSAYPPKYNQILTDICEGFSVNHCELINVLNWKHMTCAVLKLKAQHSNLCDGEQTFFVHGFREDELFTLRVENNEVFVSDGGENPLELTHKEAMQAFFGLYSEKRSQMPANIAGWLPLEFMIFSTDTV